MNDLEKRLVVLDLLIARTKPLRDRQEKDLKRVKSYKGTSKEAKELLAKTKTALKLAKTERKAIIAKLLKAQDAANKSKNNLPSGSWLGGNDGATARPRAAHRRHGQWRG